jgi:MinD superfamily P-loop ATPase
MVLIDGPPGIGCPVIASITGVDYTIVVTEPTPSGIHDLERISELCRHFSIPAGVVINKFDLNPGISGEIKKIVGISNSDFLGEIPYEPDFTRAMVQGKSLLEFNSSPSSKIIKQIWENLKSLLK